MNGPPIIPFTTATTPNGVSWNTSLLVLSVQPLHQMRPVPSPVIADGLDPFFGRLPQRNWAVVGRMGVTLDHHAVIQQYVEHAKQGQFGTAARSASGGEGPAYLA